MTAPVCLCSLTLNPCRKERGHVQRLSKRRDEKVRRTQELKSADGPTGDALRVGRAPSARCF